MTSREFTESFVFERLEPEPVEKMVGLLAILVTMMANDHRDPKHKPNPYTVDDFLPNPYAPSKQVREAAFAGLMASYAEHSRKKKEQTH